MVLDEIKKSCLLAAGRLDADFRAIVSIAVSNVHTGYLKIRRCYEEVEEVLRQQNALKHSAYVTQHRELALIKQKAEAGASPRAAAPNPKKDGKKWVNVEEIKAYIDSHYTAPDLTVGALSDRFHMTAANLAPVQAEAGCFPRWNTSRSSGSARQNAFRSHADEGFGYCQERGLL